jgi:hypothetical protein
VRRRSLILALATTLVVEACSKSAFERAHVQAVAQNPAGIELQIKTMNGSNKFRAGDLVRFEESYTSRYPGWHIEVLDGWNEASTADEVFVTDGSSIWKAEEPPLWGFICCNSRHVWLSLDPVRVTYQPTQHDDIFMANHPGCVLPMRPGRYNVYITTFRVFERDHAMTTYGGKGIAVTSENILTVEVVK